MERYFGVELIEAAPDVLISSARRRAQQRLVEVVNVSVPNAVCRAKLCGLRTFECGLITGVCEAGGNLVRQGPGWQAKTFPDCMLVIGRNRAHAEALRGGIPQVEALRVAPKTLPPRRPSQAEPIAPKHCI